jgi:hypothetical protein
VDLGIGRGRSAGETVSAAYGFIGIRQNDSFLTVSGVHLGNVGSKKNIATCRKSCGDLRSGIDIAADFIISAAMQHEI